MIASFSCCCFKYYVSLGYTGFVDWSDNPTNPYLIGYLYIYENPVFDSNGLVIFYSRRLKYSFNSFLIATAGIINEGACYYDGGVKRDNGSGYGVSSAFYSNSLFEDIRTAYNSLLGIPMIYDTISSGYGYGVSTVTIDLPFDSFLSPLIRDFLIKNNL